MHPILKGYRLFPADLCVLAHVSMCACVCVCDACKCVLGHDEKHQGCVSSCGLLSNMLDVHYFTHYSQAFFFFKRRLRCLGFLPHLAVQALCQELCVDHMTGVEPVELALPSVMPTISKAQIKILNLNLTIAVLNF